MNPDCIRRPKTGAVFLYALIVFLTVCTGAPTQERGSSDDDMRLPAESGVGAAFLVGEPMGLSAKIWISEVSALDAGAGWSFYRRTDDGMHIQGAPYFYFEYLRHFYNAVKAQTGKFVYFIGVGAETVNSSEMYFGVRIPFGMSYMFESAPLDVFLELVPSVVFIPGVTVTSDTGACAGLRYWF
ncbi:MAG: hypothetical protein LBT68_05840 [Spirochaetales bacterium]|jgi:hypothetical protein|nr:hypothetical protein [Spirochaetales bacterium]